MHQNDPQPSFNRPEDFANFRVTELNDAFEFTKQTWENYGPFILKQIVPAIAVLAFLQYVLSTIPILIGMLPLPIIADLSSIAVSLMLFPFNLALVILLQAVVFGMYRPLSLVALHGQNGIPTGQSFISMARQNIMTLVIVSAATTIGTAIGVCLLVIPAIIVGILAQPTAYLVSTRGMSMVDAVKASIEVIKANLVPVLVYHAIFAAIGTALMIPALILLFGSAFVVAYISPAASNFFPAGITATIYILTVPVYTFVLGTLYTRLIDAPQTTLQPATDNPQPPAQPGW